MSELATTVIREVLDRTGLAPDEVDDVLLGQCYPNGEAPAIGRVAADAGWAGITAIETDPAHRRRGLARAVTAALATRAAARGATGLYLQVEDGNAAARTLYEGMGFTGHHRYHYRVAP